MNDQTDSPLQSPADPGKPCGRLLLLLAMAIAVPALPLVVFESVGVSLHDAPAHVRWLHAFHRGLANGAVAPGWSDEAFAGFGAFPLMIYGRVAYYLLSPLVSVTGDAWTALRFGVPAMFLLSAWLSYRTGRLFFDRRNSLLVAIAYVLGPYCVFAPYSQFSITEHAALVVIPWSLTRLILMLRRPNAVNLVWFGASYALVVYSHLIAAFVFGGTLLAIALAVPTRLPRWRALAWMFGGVLLGLGLTAFYWPFAVLGPQAGDAVRQWYAEAYERVHFIFGFGPYHWLIPDTAMPLGFLLTASLALILGVGRSAGLRLSGRFGALWWALPILIVFTVLIESPLAKPVWNASSLLKQVQQPYRFHAALQLPVALLLVATWMAMRNLPRRTTLRQMGFAAWATVFVANVGLGAALPWYLYATKQKTVASLGRTGPERPDFPYCAPPTAQWQRVMAEQASTDWKVRGVGQVTVDEWRPERREFHFESGCAPIDVRTFHDPGWRLEVDGQPVALSAGRQYGQIRFDASPGRHHAVLTFHWPLRCRVGAVVALVAGIACLGLLSRTYLFAPCAAIRRAGAAKPDGARFNDVPELPIDAGQSFPGLTASGPE